MSRLVGHILPASGFGVASHDFPVLELLRLPPRPGPIFASTALVAIGVRGRIRTALWVPIILGAAILSGLVRSWCWGLPLAILAVLGGVEAGIGSAGVSFAPPWVLGLFLGAWTPLVCTILLTWAVRERRRALARPPLACRACGYDLRRVPEGAVCPECGAAGPGPVLALEEDATRGTPRPDWPSGLGNRAQGPGAS